MPNLDITSNVFTKSLTLDNQTKVLNLSTSDKFIDKNISIEISAPTVTDINVNLTNISSDSIVTVGTLSNNFYPIRTTNLSINGTISPENSGWVDENNYYGISQLYVDRYTIGKMAAAAITVSGTGATATIAVAPGNVTISTATNTVSGKTKITTLIPTTATGSISTYYMAIKANAAANSTGASSTISGITTASVTTAGYAPTSLTGSGNISGTATATTTSKDSSTYYIPIPTANLSITGGGLTAGNGTAAISSDGYYNGSNYVTSDTIVLATSQANGYYKITASGYGLVNLAAVKKQITSAGWLPQDNAATTAIATTSVYSNTGTQAYYIKKSTSTTSTSNGTTTITISDGYYPSAREFLVAGGETVTPTTSYSNIGMSTYFNSLNNSTGASVTITPQYSTTAGAVNSATNESTGGIGYWAIKTTSRSASTGYVTLTKGNGSVTVVNGIGDSASSSNTSLDLKTTTPSSGVYYTITAKGSGSVSGTGRGVVSTGTGWVTSGSTTSNNSTSTATTSNEATTAVYIIKSVHGSVVSGSQPSSISGRTSGTYQDIEIQPNGYLKIPAGYSPIDRYVFANKADVSSEATSASGYTLSISSVSGDTTVGVGTLASGYYPITASNLSITGTLTAGTAGWFSSGSATDNDTDNVTVGKMQAAAIAASGTGATATIAVAPGNVTITTATNTVSGKTKLTTLAPTTVTTGISTYYMAIKANAAANSTGTSTSIAGTVTATVSTAGYASTTLTGSGSVSGTATATTTSKDSSVYYIPIPTVSGSIGGTASSGSATAAITNVNNIATVASPTGTAGTDYWAIKATATGNNGSYTPKYTVNTNGAGWLNATVTGSAQTVSVTSDTTGQTLYIPKAAYGGSNGNITITSAGYLPQGEIVASMNTVTPAFDGGALNSTTATAVGTNVTIDTSSNNGITIQTKGTAGRDAVLYNGSVNGYVSISDNTTASAAVAASTWNGALYYITAITVPKDKPFSLTTQADTALDTTSNITITNNAYRQLKITNNANGDVDITTSGKTDVVVGSSSAGVVTVKAYPRGTGTTIVAEKTIISAGRWAGDSGVKTPSPTSQTGPFYGEIYVAPMSSGTAASISSEGSVTTAPSVTIGGTTNMTTTSSGDYYFTRTGTASNGTIQTKWKNATAGYAAQNTSGTNSGTVTVTPTKTADATIYIPTATVTIAGGALNSTAATAEFVNSNNKVISTASTDTYNNGLKITAKGTAGRAAITYTNTVGYIPAHTSAQSGLTATQATTWSGTDYYLTGVKIAAPSSGTATFDITVPNGSTTEFITFKFKVDSSGNVWVEGV